MALVASPEVRLMKGYFTAYKWIRGQSMSELETRIGYRRGRLTSQGVLIYRFLRLPLISEFDLRGTTIWTEQAWQTEVAPERNAALARSAAYHQNNPNVPDSDLVLKRLALASMSLDGPDLLVKLIPKESAEIDESPLGYQHGSGIAQWRLNLTANLSGRLLFKRGGQDSVPWRLP